MADTQRQFDAALKFIKSLPENGPVKLTNAEKLTLYGLYKVVEEGPCTSSKPWVNPVARAKWDAWYAVSTMDRETAMRKYVQMIAEIIEDAPIDAAYEDARRQTLSVIRGAGGASGASPGAASVGARPGVARTPDTRGAAGTAFTPGAGVGTPDALQPTADEFERTYRPTRLGPHVHAGSPAALRATASTGAGVGSASRDLAAARAADSPLPASPVERARASPLSDAGFSESFEQYANCGLVTVNFHKVITSLDASVARLEASAAATVARLDALDAALVAVSARVNETVGWRDLAASIVLPLSVFLLVDKVLFRQRG